MKKTIFITGASTGIGLETALYFNKQGWNVAATMRHPENRETPLHVIPEILKCHLDVLDVQSIRDAIHKTIDRFGKIDTVVNNAGYGLIGPFESASEEQIRRQFDTNVFGLMSVVQEILPLFREAKNGTIINVSSMGGRITFPLYSFYNGTKWAVEGFSEGLQHELKPFNIKIKLVEPGAIKTDFYDRSMDLTHKEGLNVYDEYVSRVMKNIKAAGEHAPPASKVAIVIWKAANDASWKLRYPVATQGLLFLRWLLPSRLFSGLLRRAVLR